MRDLPPAQGLYDPQNEHDSCGVSFVCDIHGRASHDIVMTGVGALCNMEHRGAQGADINTAKIRLANEATTLLHGADAAKTAAETAMKTFVSGGTAEGLPTFETPSNDLASFLVVDASLLCELCASKGEARRHIKAGALKINDKPVSDHTALLSDNDINEDGVIKLSVGKKKHALLKPV